MANRELMEYIHSACPGMSMMEINHVDIQLCHAVPQLNARTRIIPNDIHGRRRIVYEESILEPPPPAPRYKYKRVRLPGWKALLWRVAGELTGRNDWTAKGCTTLRTEVPQRPPSSGPVRRNRIEIEVQHLAVAMPDRVPLFAPSNYAHVLYAYFAPRDELHIEVLT